MADYEWSCTSCTFDNHAGSFKCFVCGTPKGTATRQVKFHMSAIEQQYVAESLQSINKLQGSRSAHYSKSLQQGHASNISNQTSSSNDNTGTSGTSISQGVFTKKRLRSKGSSTSTRERKWPRLSNLNRSSSRVCEVTVNNVTVTITEYDLYDDST